MTLKVGIIGLGIGEAHLEGFLRLPECEVTAACDLDETKRAEIQKKYPDIPLCADAREVLTNSAINLVSIASFDDCHFKQIQLALENGKHVFVEKPLCLYETEAREIRRLLQKKPSLKLSSNLILRKSPRFLYLKKAIQKGALGKLFYVEGDYNYGRLHKITDGWRGELEFYSVVLGGGVHMIDLFHWLVQDRVQEVVAYGNRIAAEGTRFRYDDLVSCLLKFKSGIIAKMAVNFGCVFPHFHPLTVYGTAGTFVNGFESGKLFRSREWPANPEEIREPYPGVHKGGLIEGFVNTILKGTEPEVSADDVFNAISVCFAIDKSVKKNKPVKVEYI